MAELEERPYVSSDLAALREMWSRVYDAESVRRRESAFRWIAEGNPYCPEGAPRHMIFQGDIAVGTLGRMPLRYRAYGRPVEVHYSHDLLADPACRGQGLGKRLVRAVAAAAPGLAGGLWMTDACYMLHQRVGWKAVQPFHGHRLVINASAALGRRLGSAWLGGLLGPLASVYLKFARPGTPPGEHRISEIPRFDTGTDRLFERVADRFGIIAERHHAYLNWKYVDSPHVRYRRFLVGSQDDPDAYVVTRLDPRDEGYVGGLVVDLLADPDVPGAFDAALAVAARSLREEGAAVMDVLTTHPDFRRRLESCGFTRGTRLYTFVITGDEPGLEGKDLLDPANWYLTLGDSDGDMWSSAQSWAIDRQATSPRDPTSAR